jgi:hypothetical protein
VIYHVFIKIVYRYNSYKYTYIYITDTYIYIHIGIGCEVAAQRACGEQQRRYEMWDDFFSGLHRRACMRLPKSVIGRRSCNMAVNGLELQDSVP